IETFNYMFIIAFQMSIPIVGCLFLVDVALGIIARTVPQLNVFVVGLPIKIFVSFVVLLVFLSLYTTLTKSLFSTMFNTKIGRASCRKEADVVMGGVVGTEKGIGTCETTK